MEHLQILSPREVPLGGPRAMTVRRTIPSRARSLVGAWCFLDHYGPDDVADTGGMSVAPHPHTGLQTVSWLFTGEVEHRDSAGLRKVGANNSFRRRVVVVCAHFSERRRKGGRRESGRRGGAAVRKRRRGHDRRYASDYR